MTEQNEKVVRRHAGCPEEDALIYYFLVSLKSFRAVGKTRHTRRKKGICGESTDMRKKNGRWTVSTLKMYHQSGKTSKK